MKLLALLILFIFFTAFPARADGVAIEARAKALGAELRCVTCQGETVNDSESKMAKAARGFLREKIAAGWSDERITGALRERYGDFILLDPPFQKNTWLLWLCPLLFLAAGAGAAALLIKRRRP